jgi:hypothetical protein
MRESGPTASITNQARLYKGTWRATGLNAQIYSRSDHNLLASHMASIYHVAFSASCCICRTITASGIGHILLDIYIGHKEYQDLYEARDGI